MPTSTFTIPDSHIVIHGQLVSVNSGALWHFASGTRIQLACVGSSAVLQLFDCTVAISVDGGAPSSVVIPAAWTFQSLYSGLSDAVHTVSVQVTANASNGYVNSTQVAGGSVQVTGAAPALNDPALGQYTPFVGGAFVVEGGLVAASIAQYTAPQLLTSAWPDGAVRFQAACSAIKVWMYQAGTKIRFQQDGVDGALVTAPATVEYDWVTLASGLDPTTVHEYGFAMASTGTPYVYAVLLVGGSGLGAAPPAHPVMAAYGDSITFTQYNESSTGYTHLLGMARKYAVANRGVGGSTTRQFGAGGAPVTTAAGEATTRVPDVTGLSPAASKVLILYGTNDLNQVGGAETQAQFQASYQQMLTRLLAGLGGGCKVYCIGILPRSDYSLATVASWNSYIVAAIAAVADSRVQYVASSGWGLDNGGNYATNYLDGTHPNAAGYALIAAGLGAVLGGAGHGLGLLGVGS